MGEKSIICAQAWGSMKYRIAIFTSDWNYNLVTQFYDGLYRFLDEHQEVTVFVFDCFAGKAEEGDAGYSEFQIFNLPDLHDFDGAVIQGNQILSDKLRNQIIARAAEADIPIVSSNYPSKGCTYIGTENYEAMSEIVEHLISHHGVRKMAYIGGYIESREAKDRKRLLWTSARSMASLSMTHMILSGFRGTEMR